MAAELGHADLEGDTRAWGNHSLSAQRSCRQVASNGSHAVSVESGWELPGQGGREGPLAPRCQQPGRVRSEGFSKSISSVSFWATGEAGRSVSDQCVVGRLGVST